MAPSVVRLEFKTSSDASKGSNSLVITHDSKAHCEYQNTYLGRSGNLKTTLKKVSVEKPTKWEIEVDGLGVEKVEPVGSAEPAMEYRILLLKDTIEKNVVNVVRYLGLPNTKTEFIKNGQTGQWAVIVKSTFTKSEWKLEAPKQMKTARPSRVLSPAQRVVNAVKRVLN